MTFEEFFRKKKIDLIALQQAEPSLFSEFKAHFQQMGEKSFDHTKKYWFNKLRLQYHLAPEVKEEKVVIEKPLAEQTVTQTLSETTLPPAGTGFKPRFKPGTTKPHEPAPEPKAETPAPESEKPAETTPPPANVGFKPRFKAGITKTADPIPEQKEEPKAETSPETPAEDKPAPDTTAKPVYKPRFNVKNIKPKTEE